MTTVTRPALRYYGGKWNLAPWIISFFPPHLNYVEPCGGAASVLLQKPRSPLETYNDLDGNVVNFFRVLRDQPEELIRRLWLTPWARTEHELSLCPCDNPIENARRFFTMAWQTVAGNPNSGWRRQVRYEVRTTIAPIDGIDLDHLWCVADRLKTVQLESKDACFVIKNYDAFDTLIYFDPPYVEETRSATKQYAIDWHGYEMHIAAADLLRTAVGYVIISGYACPLYTDLYERHGWQRHDKVAQTNSGGKRIESVWLSPRTAEAIARPQQQGLFA